MREVTLERIDCTYRDVILGVVAVLLVLGLMGAFVLLAREMEKREGSE